nr:hypothetical protein [Tanacetum cinerariifolium]GEY17819.1 hypothetical protein [Tanacetum cinerariifolium]
MTIPNPQRHVVPTAILTKSRLVPITAARPVTADVLKPHVTRPRHAKTIVTKSHSPPRRNINHSPSPKASTFPPKVTVAKDPIVNAVKGNWKKHFSISLDELVEMFDSSRTGGFDSRANERPPMLEKGNYIPWESRPYKRPMIPNPDNDQESIHEPLSKMTEGIHVKNAKDLWERIKRLMFGFVVTSHMRRSLLIDEFYKFAAKEGETLESVYERVDAQTKNAGYGGNGKANVQCYNCNEKGHYAYDSQKPRVRNEKYFKEQMLLAMKDEAGSNLKDEENDFMLDNSYGEETIEELTNVVMLMARIQPADGNAETMPSYDAKAVIEVNPSSKVNEQVSHVKCKTIIHTFDDDQIDSNIIFDDPYVENNGSITEHDSNAHDEYHEIQMLAYNVPREAKNKKRLNNELKKQK